MPAAKLAPKSRAKALAATTLETEVNAIFDLLKQGEDMHWKIGVHYNIIVDRGLAQSKGCATAQDTSRRTSSCWRSRR